jgi:hypothetical protein
MKTAIMENDDIVESTAARATATAEQNQRITAQAAAVSKESKAVSTTAPPAKARAITQPPTFNVKSDDGINVKASPPAAKTAQQKPENVDQSKEESSRRAMLAHRLTLQAREREQQQRVEKSKVPIAPVIAETKVAVMQATSRPTVTKNEIDYTKAESTARAVATEKQNELNRRALLAYRLSLHANEQKKRAMTVQAAVTAAEIPTAPAATTQEVLKKLSFPPAMVAEEKDSASIATEKQNELTRRALLAYRLTLLAKEQKQRPTPIKAVKKVKVSKPITPAKAQALDWAQTPTVKLEETVMAKPDVAVGVTAAPSADSLGDKNKESVLVPTVESSATTQAPAVDAKQQQQVVVLSPMAAAAKLYEISAMLESARDTGSVSASTQLDVVDAILTEVSSEAEEKMEEATNNNNNDVVVAAVSAEATPTAKLDQIYTILLEVRKGGGGSPPPDTASAEAQLQAINDILATTSRARIAAASGVASPKGVKKGQKSSRKSSKSPAVKKKSSKSPAVKKKSKSMSID